MYFEPFHLHRLNLMPSRALMVPLIPDLHPRVVSVQDCDDMALRVAGGPDCKNAF